MATIKVPKPPRRAFNPDRRASDLLKQQVDHLEWAVRHAGERRAAGYHRSKAVIRTEADAARRTAELVQRLPSAAQLPTYTAPITEEPRAARAKRARKTTKKRKVAKKR
jgi:hypothetical protein